MHYSPADVNRRIANSEDGDRLDTDVIEQALFGWGDERATGFTGGANAPIGSHFRLSEVARHGAALR